MIFWQVIIIIFAFFSYYTSGFNVAMWVTVVLQTIYIAKFFWWETGYFNTLDITLDRAG
jgi:7-dehydrocholesterol reductase